MPKGKNETRRCVVGIDALVAEVGIAPPRKAGCRCVSKKWQMQENKS